MSEAETIVDAEAIREAWIGNLTSLMDEVESTARSLGWAIERTDKPMKDPAIGRYTAPSLVMQRRFTQLILDPVDRDGSGGDGVVDFYRLPAWDDVARLYSQDGRWKVHRFPEEKDPTTSGYDRESDDIGRAMITELLERLAGHGE